MFRRLRGLSQNYWVVEYYCCGSLRRYGAACSEVPGNTCAILAILLGLQAASINAGGLYSPSDGTGVNCMQDMCLNPYLYYLSVPTPIPDLILNWSNWSNLIIWKPAHSYLNVRIPLMTHGIKDFMKFMIHFHEFGVYLCLETSHLLRRSSLCELAVCGLWHGSPLSCLPRGQGCHMALGQAWLAENGDLFSIWTISPHSSNSAICFNFFHCVTTQPIIHSKRPQGSEAIFSSCWTWSSSDICLGLEVSLGNKWSTRLDSWSLEPQLTGLSIT